MIHACHALLALSHCLAPRDRPSVVRLPAPAHQAPMRLQTRSRLQNVCARLASVQRQTPSRETTAPFVLPALIQLVAAWSHACRVSLAKPAPSALTTLTSASTRRRPAPAACWHPPMRPVLSSVCASLDMVVSASGGERGDCSHLPSNPVSLAYVSANASVLCCNSHRS